MYSMGRCVSSLNHGHHTSTQKSYAKELTARIATTLTTQCTTDGIRIHIKFSNTGLMRCQQHRHRVQPSECKKISNTTNMICHCRAGSDGTPAMELARYQNNNLEKTKPKGISVPLFVMSQCSGYAPFAEAIKRKQIQVP